MRVLMLAQSTPYLPTHERARQAPAYLLAHSAERHSMAVIAPDARGETPAQQAWASTLTAWTARVPAGRWRHPFSGAPAEGLATLRAAALRAIAKWTPDVVHV